jgi:hypothetical protein
LYTRAVRKNDAAGRSLRGARHGGGSGGNRLWTRARRDQPADLADDHGADAADHQADRIRPDPTGAAPARDGAARHAASTATTAGAIAAALLRFDAETRRVALSPHAQGRHHTGRTRVREVALTTTIDREQP